MTGRGNNEKNACQLLCVEDESLIFLLGGGDAGGAGGAPLNERRFDPAVASILGNLSISLFEF
jgi:hypothetical protein